MHIVGRYIPSRLNFVKNLLTIFLLLSFTHSVNAQDNSDCLMCHEDNTLTGTRNGKKISVYVNEKKLSASVHSDVDCISCHIDLSGMDVHEEDVEKAKCNMCHDDIQARYDKSLHGVAFSKGDKLAPSCQDCHGSHEIIKVKNLNSKVSPMNIPRLCGQCHKEGSPVQIQRNIPQTHILENYSESIHGEGLLKKGLIVTATCVSCHTSHDILPHTDPKSSIARRNIAGTCANCHAEIEEVHRKVIKGELWEKEANRLPACVDCHQPHLARRVFYDQGMADQDCLNCHSRENIKDSEDHHSLFVDYSVIKNSRHTNISCSQCHTQVSPSHVRPCDSITQKVDCASCHAAVGEEYQLSIHGKLNAANDSNAPVCTECHGTHEVLGKTNPVSPIFAINIPTLCGNCHRDGETAAIRYQGTETDIVKNYTESIHGKGLMKSGLTVTATCTDCHTAHRELPHDDPLSSVHTANIPSTCGNCHHGIEEKFEKSIHSVKFNKTDKELPTCESCHTAHKIIRADSEGFKLKIMDQCGRCHEGIAKTYFDTYHGKVSQLGYTKTAKCYDCHGAHDILPIENPASNLNRKNIVETCKKCHPGANKQFAGYFTHATHHDPDKYPWLFWTFWGMTGLLIFTFVISGIHTILWLPRSLQWRRELKRRKLNIEKNNKDQESL